MNLREMKIKARIDPVKFMADNGTDFSGLHPSLREGYARWWCWGVCPGTFLTAVIFGDLFDAIGKADEKNAANLKGICTWFWNNADSRSIRKNAKGWMEVGGYFGRMDEMAGEGVTNGL